MVRDYTYVIDDRFMKKLIGNSSQNDYYVGHDIRFNQDN